MLHRSAEPQSYAESVAKIEINLPGDLVKQIDRVAERVGESRDELLARVAEHEVDRIDWQLRKELEQMVGPAVPRGGNATQIIREERDRHPRRHDAD